jgi:hypothetical protein
MDLSRAKIYAYACVLIFFLSITTEWYKELSVILFALQLLIIVVKFGKGLILRELIAIYTVFMCLLMPVLGYQFYSADNYLARIFGKFMQVPAATYFAFALPAITAFVTALCWPVKIHGMMVDEGLYFRDRIDEIRKQLKADFKPGFYLLGIGIFFSMLAGFIPGELNFIAILFYFSSFAGILYIYFAPQFPFKKIILWLFALFTIQGAINTGMFTVVAYMGLTIISFFFLNKKLSALKKVMFLCSALVFLVVLQNVKSSYRKLTWKSEYSGNKSALFGNLFLENLQKGDALIEKNAFFPLYIRSNQGYNVSLVMRRIPVMQPYDNGRRLTTVLASAFVPRFLWPDKPEAGGKESMKYFTGWVIHGWSTNVGPLGEAYGSFGVNGGIFYMFLIGLIIRYAYKKVFTISANLPLLILWIPFLFYQITYSAETDSLQIFNSLIKSSFFLWLLYKALPGWFGKQQRQPIFHNNIVKPV